MKQLKPTQVRLTGYSGNVVPTTGTCRIECKLRDKPHTLELFIADTHATPILGFDSCRAMGLVTIENRVLNMSHTEVAAVKTVDLPPTIPKDIAEEYPELFQGLGQFPRIHTMQTRPFQMVAVDVFECDGKHYLSLQDYYSRYIEVERLYSTRASFIIMNMKGIMARHGIPEQVFSNSGPQFSCAEFAQFANTWGFVHSTSSPRYPQSNVLAEKAVQTAKRIAMKATASRRDPYIALLEYRTTPISDCGKSPAQLLMSRRLSSILPSTPASLQPVLVNPEDIQLRFEEKQDKQKTVYDRNARIGASISVGDQILMRKSSGGYQSAVVTEKTDAPRSYNVRTKDGAIY